MPNEHSSVVGGSSANRVIECPGSVVLCQEAPPQTSSPYAQEGSALHDIMERWLDHTANTLEDAPHPSSWIGKRHMGIEITQRLYDVKLKPCIEFFNELDPDTWFCEYRVDWGDQAPGGFGTGDIFYRKGKRGGYLDWKFGDGVAVSANENSQIMFYLGGAALHTLPEFFEGVEEFDGHIFQPFEDGREPHAHAVYKRSDLIKFGDILAEAIRQSRANDPKLKIGDHCRWCAARAICPKLRDAAAGAVDSDVEAMDKDELLYWLDLVDELELFAKAIRTYAADFHRRTEALDGYKITATLGNRYFKSQAEAEAWGRSRGFLVRDLKPPKFVSPAGMEKLMKAKGIPKDDPEFLALVDRKVTGEKLVPESAKGEAVKSPQAIFSNLSKQLQAMNFRG